MLPNPNQPFQMTDIEGSTRLRCFAGYREIDLLGSFWWCLHAAVPHEASPVLPVYIGLIDRVLIKNGSASRCRTDKSNPVHEPPSSFTWPATQRAG